MSKYSKEVKEKVISLFEKELSPFRIAKELAISEDTVKKAQAIVVERLRKIYPLQFMLKYFGISRSTFLFWLTKIRVVIFREIYIL